MDFVQLTDGQRREFDKNGFLIVRNVLDDNLIAQLTADADRLMQAHMFDVDGQRTSGLQVHLREGVVQLPSFAPLLSHAATVPLVVQLLGPNIHLHTATITYKDPEPDGEEHRGWHRDIGLSEDLGHRGLPRVGIKVCYCLTDFLEPRSGLTLMAAGSQLNQTPLQIAKGDVDPAAVVEARLGAGDALLFENRTFHASAPKRTGGTSKAVFYGYSFRWMKVEANLFPPDARLLENAKDDVERQLLGGYASVDTPPEALRHWAELHGAVSQPIPWTTEVL